MADDDTFRIALITVMGIFFPFAAYFRARSNATREKLDRWQEGIWILFGLRLAAVVPLVGGLLWLIHPPWLAWFALPLPAWLRWIGVAICVLGGSLQIWTFATLGKNLTDTVVTRKEHTLVTSGPYRFVRHPFYLVFLFAALGGSLVMANWFFAVAGILPFAFIVARVPIEEGNLLKRFGEEYREYRARTGAFLPRFERPQEK